jgi:molybdopterin-guanine dinucleotide biosynthesis protein A
MGAPKLTLPFGPEVMLARVVRLLSEAVRPVVVVAAVGQVLPDLPPDVLTARDRQPDRGPLEGLGTGLAALPAGVDAAFVAACDQPLLRPAFIRRMIDLSEGYDAAVVFLDEIPQPLSAVYRTSVLPEIETLLAADRRRPAYLFDRVRTRRVLAREMTDVDPELQSLANVNSPADYDAALRAAGLVR